MKRKILVLFVLLSLLLSLAISASAVESTLVPSEDLQTVVLDGETYVTANTVLLEGDYFSENVTCTLTPEQEETYDEISLFCWERNSSVIKVAYRHKNGMVMEMPYIHEDLLVHYQALLEQEEYTVKFLYPYDNDAIVEKALLCGEQTTLYYDDLRGANNFVVYAEGQEHLRIHRGWLVAGKEAYYYVDRLENELSSDEQIYNLPKVTAWKVTDTDLCARFDEALDRYYDDGLGMLENPEVTDRVSVVFLIILFGFLPFAVLVTFTVFAIVTKKRVYRIQYIIVGSCALLVLVTVLVTFLIV